MNVTLFIESLNFLLNVDNKSLENHNRTCFSISKPAKHLQSRLFLNLY